MPCLTHPHPRTSGRPSRCWWLAGVLAGAALQAQASAPDTARERLLKAAQQWVADNQQVAPSQVRFAALDSRVRVEDCDKPLQVDYAFSRSRETVRVRCHSAQPWQLFLRVLPGSLPEQAGQPAQPGSAGTNAAPGTLAVATKPTVVARRLIQRGTVLDPSMLEVMEKPALGLDPLAVGSLKDVEMAEAMRDIPAGTVLRSYDIKRAIMVKKGQTALLSMRQTPGLQISVRVEAQQDGYMGEQIRLKNTESGRLLSGVVIGPNAVRDLQGNN